MKCAICGQKITGEWVEVSITRHSSGTRSWNLCQRDIGPVELQLNPKARKVDADGFNGLDDWGF